MLDPVTDITEQITRNVNIRRFLDNLYNSGSIKECPDAYVRGKVSKIHAGGNVLLINDPFIVWNWHHIPDLEVTRVEPCIGTWSPLTDEAAQKFAIKSLVAVFCVAHDDKDTPVLRQRIKGLLDNCLRAAGIKNVHREHLGCITLKITNHPLKVESGPAHVVEFLLGEYVPLETVIQNLMDRI